MSPATTSPAAAGSSGGRNCGRNTRQKWRSTTGRSSRSGDGRKSGQRRRDTLLDMTSSYAALNVRQRAQRVLPDGTIELVATEQDFLAAAWRNTALDTTGGGQTSKLLKSERTLIDTVMTMNVKEFTVNELQKWMGHTPNHIWRILHGRMEKSHINSGGLLAKCPALGVVETMTIDENIDPVKRRKENQYMFDPVQFKEWNRGGGVFLTPGPGFPDDDLRPPEMPRGDDVVMEGGSKGGFTKTVMKGYSSVPGSDCTNNITIGTTIPPFQNSMRDPISGAVVCDDVHTCSYGSGKRGDSEIKTQDCSRTPDTDSLCGDLDCRMNPPSIPPPENKGNSPANQSGVIPLPGL